MPMYDYQCDDCKLRKDNELRPMSDTTIPCQICGGTMRRVWSTTAQAIGDEIDVEIKHGLCHADGSPRRFRSREALEKAAKEAGYLNYVEHKPPPGTDKSRHTINWNVGLPPGVDGRPMSLLNDEEKKARKREWESL